MTTQIRRRFNVTSDILDRVAGQQTTSQPAILISGAHANAQRFNVVTRTDWKTLYSDETSAVYKWLSSLFSQSRPVRNAVVIHQIPGETVTTALDDAVLLGAEWYFLCAECTDAQTTTPDGTEVINTPQVDFLRTLPGQSVSTVDRVIVASINGVFVAANDPGNILGTAGTRETTTSVDGLVTVQTDTLAYTAIDDTTGVQTNFAEVLGQPNTTGTFVAPADHTYTEITEGAITETRVTLNAVTSVTKITDPFIQHTEVADAPLVTGDDLTAIDESIDGTYQQVTTTPGGYTPTDVNHPQVVENFVVNALSCVEVQTQMASYVEAASTRMMLFIQTSDAEALNAVSTTDIGKALRDLTQNRTVAIYHPESVQLVDQLKDTSGERVDAAIIGRMATSEAGSEQWDYQNLVGISDSGLSGAQQDLLNSKGYNFFETFKKTAFGHLFNSRSVTSREIRIQWGADFIDIQIETSLATYAFNNELMAFDEETFSDVEAILYQWRNEALDRRLIVDTEDRPSVISLPDPDSFSAAQRASGIADIDDAYCWSLNSKISEWVLTGQVKIGE